MNGRIRVGRTRPIPSGNLAKRPRARIRTVRGSVGRMIASPRPSSRASSRAAGPVADERVRTRLDEEAVATAACRPCRRAGPGLDEERRDSRLPERVRGGQAGDAATDDEDRHRPDSLRPARDGAGGHERAERVRLEDVAGPGVGPGTRAAAHLRVLAAAAAALVGRSRPGGS